MFSGLFMMQGGFYICLAVGKFIEELGGTHTLAEVGMLIHESLALQHVPI